MIELEGWKDIDFSYPEVMWNVLIVGMNDDGGMTNTVLAILVEPGV